MFRASTAICAAEVVLAIEFVNMRPPGPNRFLGNVYSLVDQHGARVDHLLGLVIKFPAPNSTVAALQRLALGGIVVDDPGTPIVIKKDRRINAAKPEGDWI